MEGKPDQNHQAQGNTRLKHERIVLVDLEGCDELEYRGFVVTRIQPRNYFFKNEAFAAPEVYTSAKAAIHAIDALLEMEGTH